MLLRRVCFPDNTCSKNLVVTNFDENQYSTGRCAATASATFTRPMHCNASNIPVLIMLWQTIGANKGNTGPTIVNQNSSNNELPGPLYDNGTNLFQISPF